MNRIGDDDDFGNAITIWGLVDTTPDSKKFHFSTSNMNCMVDGLDDRAVMSVHM